MSEKEFMSPEILLSLYEIYSQDNRAYNSIVWQFPVALLTANAIILSELWDKPLIILVFPIVNFALLHALFKLGYNQGAIIASLQSIEKFLQSYCSEELSQVIPDFRLMRPRVLNMKSRWVISWTLLLLNIVYMFVSVYNVLVNYIWR